MENKTSIVEKQIAMNNVNLQRNLIKMLGLEKVIELADRLERNFQVENLICYTPFDESGQEIKTGDPVYSGDIETLEERLVKHIFENLVCELGKKKIFIQTLCYDYSSVNSAKLYCMGEEVNNLNELAYYILKSFPYYDENYFKTYVSPVRLQETICIRPLKVQQLLENNEYIAGVTEYHIKMNAFDCVSDEVKYDVYNEFISKYFFYDCVIIENPKRVINNQILVNCDIKDLLAVYTGDNLSHGTITPKQEEKPSEDVKNDNKRIYSLCIVKTNISSLDTPNLFNTEVINRVYKNPNNGIVFIENFFKEKKLDLPATLIHFDRPFEFALTNVASQCNKDKLCPMDVIEYQVKWSIFK